VGKRFDSILETIGDTPVVKLDRMAIAGIDLYVKIEAFNPLGSVKDRMALAVIEDAERRGALRPGQTVIEATSGNTGIGLAMVCARKGYPLVVTMAENFSVERRKLMRFLGARVVLTPASDRGTGMLAKAVELAEHHGWFLCRQFENEANAEAHSRTTAQEILRDFEGQRLDYWVTGYGTGGTLKGVARVLKKERPDTRIIVCEPDNSPILGSGVRQPQAANGIMATHPSFRPHLMQGWSPDFVAPLVEQAVDAELVDGIVPVAGADAIRVAQELARKEGIFVGISSGATLAGALKVAESAPAGSSVLCMLPDTGERYLTTPLFEEIPVDMTGEETRISESTPRFHFGAGARGLPAAAPQSPTEPTPDDIAFVARAIEDGERPVVMFSLEWCEFCWSVRRLFALLEIPYRSVDLDSVEFQEGDRGGRVRSVLTERTSFTTIPQVFVGGEFVGGCTEVFDAYNTGRLQELLGRNHVSYAATLEIDPYDCLPSWLHPR